VWDTQGNQELVALVSRISVLWVLSCGSGCLHRRNLRYAGSASWLAREVLVIEASPEKGTHRQLKDLLVGPLLAVLYIPRGPGKDAEPSPSRERDCSSEVLTLVRIID
jgi:hypothetical protein